jgi:hypothetical protein
MGEETAAADPRSYRAIAWTILRWAGALVLTCAVVIAGWRARDYVWENTKGYHFGWDCENGFRWGMRSVEEADLVLGRQLPKSVPGPLGDVFMRKNAAKIRAAHPDQWRVGPIAFLRGYANLYDKVDDEAQKYNRGAYLLDYSPMRLLTMSVWAWHARSKEPGIQEWREELNPPMLHMNSVMELLAAAGVFFLVRKWNGTKHANVLAYVAALLVWFNPVLFLDAHVWQQWDCWLLPFFVWAIFAAASEWWLTAGMLVAVGAMFKGQMSLGASMLVLWPLLWGRWREALRAVLGMGAGVALVCWPWMLKATVGEMWFAVIAILVVLMMVRPAWARTTWFAVIGFLASIWPVAAGHSMFAFAGLGFWLIAVAAAAMGTRDVGMVSSRPIGAAHRRIAGLIVLVLAMFISGSQLGGSWAWAKIGFIYPTHHWDRTAGPGVSNLPAILTDKFDMSVYDVVLTNPVQLTFHQMMSVIYAITLVIAAGGLAIQSSRKSNKRLIAVVVPWLLMFTLLPQMLERYLLWAAVLSAMWVGVSFGMTLIHLLITTLSFSMIFHTLLWVGAFSGKHDWPKMLSFLDKLHPDAGWIMVTIAAMCLYMAVSPGRRGETKAAAPVA